MILLLLLRIICGGSVEMSGAGNGDVSPPEAINVLSSGGPTGPQRSSNNLQRRVAAQPVNMNNIRSRNPPLPPSAAMRAFLDAPAPATTSPQPAAAAAPTQSAMEAVTDMTTSGCGPTGDSTKKYIISGLEKVIQGAYKWKTRLPTNANPNCQTKIENLITASGKLKTALANAGYIPRSGAAPPSRGFWGKARNYGSRAGTAVQSWGSRAGTATRNLAGRAGSATRNLAGRAYTGTTAATRRFFGSRAPPAATQAATQAAPPPPAPSGERSIWKPSSWFTGGRTRRGRSSRRSTKTRRHRGRMHKR
jgi:hypothetical protein